MCNIICVIYIVCHPVLLSRTAAGIGFLVDKKKNPVLLHSDTALRRHPLYAIFISTYTHIRVLIILFRSATVVLIHVLSDSVTCFKFIVVFFFYYYYSVAPTVSHGSPAIRPQLHYAPKICIMSLLVITAAA